MGDRGGNGDLLAAQKDEAVVNGRVARRASAARQRPVGVPVTRCAAARVAGLTRVPRRRRHQPAAVLAAQRDPHQRVPRRAHVPLRHRRRRRSLAAMPEHAWRHEEANQRVPTPALTGLRRRRGHRLAAVLAAQRDPHQRVARRAHVLRRRLRRS